MEVLENDNQKRSCFPLPYYKAEEVYFEKYQGEIKELHKELCPDCPFDGSTILTRKDKEGRDICEFVSWIKKGDKVLFLTRARIDSKKGQTLLKDLPLDDLIGHGAIRLFYGLEQDEGKNHECPDFSSPTNFPSSIAKAIASGEMRRLAIVPDLLNEPAQAEYDRIRQQAQAEYDRIRQQALAEYDRIRQPAQAEYNRITQPAWAEYNRITQPAWAEYDRIRQSAFWDLFAIPENRIKSWR